MSPKSQRYMGIIYDFKLLSSSLWRMKTWIKEFSLYCNVYVLCTCEHVCAWECTCIHHCMSVEVREETHQSLTWVWGMWTQVLRLALHVLWRHIFLAHGQFYLLLMLLYSETKHSRYKFIVSDWKHFSCLTFLSITRGIIKYERL